MRVYGISLTSLLLFIFMIMAAPSCTVTVNINAFITVTMYTNLAAPVPESVDYYTTTNFTQYETYVATNWAQDVETGLVSNTYTNQVELVSSVTNTGRRRVSYATTNLFAVTEGAVEGPAVTNNASAGVTNYMIITATNIYPALLGGVVEYTLSNGPLLSNFVISNTSQPREWVIITNFITNAVTFKVTTNSGVFAFDTSVTNFTGTATAACAPVSIFPAGASYTNSVVLSLACATPGAGIFYSTNGGASYELYTGYISLSNSLAVSAYAVKSGYLASGASAVDYKVYRWRSLITNGLENSVVSTDIRMSPLGELFLAYYQSNAQYPDAKKLVDQTWTNVAGFLDALYMNRDPDIRIMFNAFSEPFLGYRGNSGMMAVMYKISNNNWNYVKSFPMNVYSGSVSVSDYILDNNDMPITAYSRVGDGRIAAYRFDGANWVLMGVDGFTQVGASNIVLAIGPGNMPYMAFCEDTGSKATLAVFSNGNWTAVGPSMFTGGTARFISMAFGQNGIPHLTYQEGGNADKGIVTYFSNASWNPLGGYYSSGAVNYTVIRFSPAGYPLVAYQDMANAGKASVMVYRSGAWSYLGIPAFSPGTAEHISMEISPEGVPYVAFRDNSISGMARIMKFDWKD